MIDRIIEELYASKELDDCINKMVREDLRADFKQELFLIICEWPHERTASLYESKQIKYYIVRTIINLVSQTRNVFHKKYLQENSELQDTEDKHNYEDAELKEKLFNLVEDRITEMDNHFGTFYYRALTELIKKHGSMSEAARQTGIPVSTISRGIKKIREYLNSFPNE